MNWILIIIEAAATVIAAIAAHERSKNARK